MDDVMKKALGELYAETGIPADRVVNSEEERSRFADEVRRRVGHADLTTEAIMQQLLNLRRSGGLPRVRRRAEGT
jgi:hypothetical protein